MSKRGKRLVLGLLAASLVTPLPSISAERRGLLERLREARAERMQEKTAGATTQTLRVGGLEREYLLLDDSRGKGPVPLLIVLHGGGGGPRTIVPRWEAQARAAGIVIAAPKGIGRNARSGTWNAGGCCGEASAQGVDDVAFVAAVIDDATKRTAIDPKRIYVTGFSNGGMLTHRVAIALGNRIAAAAVVSGALFGNEAAPRAPVPMLIIHGEQDPVVGFNGGVSGTRFVARAQALPFQSVRYAVDFWRKANGCGQPADITRRPDVSIEKSICKGNADVVLYDLRQGGHSWPGANVTHDAGSADPIDATSVIWNFFKAHSL
ncbi:alpha/beta hydrolase family esterase [Rhizobium sp. C4]|uniref:alpha/beta hydrolase family esterase n=1 Tax=Rhizobium sp. C4 TaxID=1349800 RepID=UPI001E6358ED|nr:PHB depolymerase family esterase [Rhizobium sp. C4]MCD2174462.1 prolyl oligopeptidase family serine peptidase [Rhizobium sp. C4]